MSTFKISGQQTLSGSISANAGKNGPVAILCAALMIRGTVVLKNMTKVEEVLRILEILSSIGVTHSWEQESTLKLNTDIDLKMDQIDRKACKMVRSSLLLLGALAAREKSYKLYKSGGCKLGARTVKPHLFALNKLGVHVESKEEYYDVSTTDLVGQHIVMYESGDTPTENAIMAAVLAKGETTLKFASANYMVQEVCRFLSKAGAQISGIGTTTLHITGVDHLQSVEYELSPDPIEAFAWISLACTSKSELTVRNCPLDFLELELEKLSVMGQKFDITNERVSPDSQFRVVDIVLLPSELSALPDKISPRPFPGLNIDNLPLFVPILTQAEGRTLVHDWIYENRALYYLELQKFGAKVMLLDPHRVLVEGKTSLIGNEVICPPAIRPAMAILIAMLSAQGDSTLRNAYWIERAYTDLVPRLSSIGANITKTDEAK